MADDESLPALYAEARRRGALLDLSERAAWRLAGADRVRYLNGQVTNDIRRVPADAAMQACATTAKGRLCGVIFVSSGPDFLRIDAEPELRESLAARFERYIIADDVVLEDVTGQECLFHLIAPEAPATPGTAPATPPGVIVRTARRFGRPGFDFIAPAAERAVLLETLAAHAVLLPPALVECLRIEAGVPRWGAELNEETLPPEAGLDEAAIDYHKGCYIGQEVISRIKSLGHVNRQLAGFAAAAPLSAGMTLHPEADPEKSAGEITSAAWSFGLESWAALGYLKRGFAGAPLIARTSPGATPGVRIRPLIP
jgi:folate-binding protein YgfZ